ncbi:MAG TPA: protein kinase [Kofleriaceae bacterium]|nr:protein kinase [Kofleriaceae bacterium]
MSQQQLGKYIVLRRLGAGGMAEVFLCKLQGIGGFEKHVVLKKIRDDAANDADFVTMFFDEARLAANLNHPNIVQTFEVDALDGMPYIAMEYVKGATLAQVLRKMKQEYLKPRYGHFASIFAGVCAGLDYAHNAKDGSGRSMQIVHRDISPQNIIVSLDGIPKIFDFGIAKARGSLALTGVDRVKGKFAYMAPEQLRAKPVDSKADVFAIGVCLYEAMTGKRPFGGGTEGELIARRLTGEFVTPSEVVHKFPAELEQIILDAMAPDPTARPSALELHQRLAAFASAAPFQSSSIAVGAWMREMFDDDSSAYDSIESSPSMTPVPASLPTGATPRPSASTVSVDRATPPPAHTPRRGRWIVGVLAAATALSATAAGIKLVRHDDHAASPAPAPIVATAPPPAPAPIVAPQPAPPPPAAVAPPSEVPAAAVAAPAPDAPPPEEVVTVERKPGPTKIVRRPTVKPKATSTKAAPVAQGSATISETKPVAPAGSAPSTPAITVPPPTGSATTTITITTTAPQSVTVNKPPPTGPTATTAPAIAVPTPASPGSLDAVPSIVRVSVDGSLTTSEVQTALGRTLDALRACYRTAAKQAKSTPDLTVKVLFEIDEGARASRVRLSGDTLGLSSCVSASVGSLRTRVAPDVGTVSVTATIRFKPTR